VLAALRHPALNWFLLAVYCLLIFIQSGLPSPEVGPAFVGKDKLLHLVAYAIMGVLACRAFATLTRRQGAFAVFMAGFLFATLFGLSDEWHQSLTPGRIADGWDLVADGVGAFLGAGGYSWYYRTSEPSFPR
jgi:VanZ family protein